MGVREDLFSRDPKTVPVTDFFGSLRPVELTTSFINITNFTKTKKKHAIEPEKKHKLLPQFPNILEYSS